MALDSRQLSFSGSIIAIHLALIIKYDRFDLGSVTSIYFFLFTLRNHIFVVQIYDTLMIIIRMNIVKI